MRRNSGLIAQHSALSWGEAILCLSLTIAMVVAAAVVEAQQPKKMPRIGILVVAYNAESTLRSVLHRIPEPIVEKIDEIEKENGAKERRPSLCLY